MPVQRPGASKSTLTLVLLESLPTIRVEEAGDAPPSRSNSIETHGMAAWPLAIGPQETILVLLRLNFCSLHTF